MMISGVGQTLPGLANFYHCGQWVEPGGMVPMAAISGRNVVQLLCCADGRSFAAHG
jgi:phytoene dehydrogenase-like protein